MALPTYLSIVNDVMVRLREPIVTAVAENTLSALVGKFVNDTKRSVADAYDWDAFNIGITVALTANVSGGYSITGAGVRFKTVNVINTTNYYELTPLSHQQYNNYYYTTVSPQTGQPQNYTFGTVDTNGDLKVSFWPIPNSADNIRFSLIVPENDFSADADTTLLSKEPIILGAYARALVERGEDGGLNSSEAYGIYKASLSDLIALELARSPENDAFTAV